MIETKSERVTVTKMETKIVSVKCDFCGKPFDKDLVENGWFNRITIDTTYSSRFDGYKFIGEICDDCMEKHFVGKLQKARIDIF